MNNKIGTWLVLCSAGVKVSDDAYSLTVVGSDTNYRGVHEGDGFIVSMEVDGGHYMVMGVGRVYRKRSSENQVTFYFDAYREIDPAIELESLGIFIPESKPAISRLGWDDYVRIVKEVTGDSPESFLPIEDRAYIRGNYSPLR